MKKEKGITLISLVILILVLAAILVIVTLQLRENTISSNSILTSTEMSIPPNGTIFEDARGEKAPIPDGFEVDKNASIVSNGLVIRDKEEGSEFVWIPVENPVTDTTTDGTKVKAMSIKKRNKV